MLGEKKKPGIYPAKMVGNKIFHLATSNKTLGKVTL